MSDQFDKLTHFFRTKHGIELIKYIYPTIIAFAWIYYVILSGSYCSGEGRLCSAPMLRTTQLYESGSAKDAADTSNAFMTGVSQQITCEPLSDTQVTTYSTVTNIHVAVFALAMFVGVVVFTYLYTEKEWNILYMLNDLNGDVYPLIMIPYAFVLLVISIINFSTKGQEVGSIWTLCISYIIMIVMMMYIISTNFAKKKADIENFRITIITLLCVACGIIFVMVTNGAYINKLQIGHAFISSTVVVICIVLALLIYYAGITLFKHYRTTPNELSREFFVGVIVFVTLVIQLILYCKHLYNCVWKTYDCTPAINIEHNWDPNTQSKGATVNIKCVPDTINYTKYAYAFIIIAAIIAVL